MRYKVYSDSTLIFDTADTDNTRQIFDAQISLELNKAGTFTFNIYPNNPAVSYLSKLKSIITVYQNDNLVFRGRILNDESGWYNEKTVTCEGEIAFLVDSIVRPYDFSTTATRKTVSEYFTYLITQHNSQVDSSKQFTVGNITVSDASEYVYLSDSTYPSTWDVIEDKLLDEHGGYLWIRHEGNVNYIDYVADFATVGAQTVKFGKNLLDVTKTAKGEEIYTCLLPLGAKLSDSGDERLTISSIADGTSGDIVKSGDMIYSSSGVASYGKIVKTETWDDVTVATNLLTKAQTLLPTGITQEFSIELTAADLAGTGQNIASFQLGNKVSIESVPHSLNANYLVKKLSISLNNPANNKLTVGTTYKAFTEQKTNVNTKINSINNTVKSQATKISNAESSIQSINTKLLPATATQATLENNWEAYDSNHESAVYWKDSTETVHLAGVIKNGTAAAGTVLFTLPENFRPRLTELFGIVSNGSLCTLEILNDGSVKIVNNASTTSLSLSGISFKASALLS